MDRLVSLLQPGFLQLLIPLRWGNTSLEEIQKFLDNMVLPVPVSSKYCHSENTESTEIAESTVLLGYIWDTFRILLGYFLNTFWGTFRINLEYLEYF